MTTKRIIAPAPFALAVALAAPHLAAQPAGYFTAVRPIPGIGNPGQCDFSPIVAPDGLTALYFSDSKLYEASRTSRNAAFGSVRALGANINGSTDGYIPIPGPTLTADGLVLVFPRNPSSSGTYWTQAKLFEARRTSVSEPFGPATPLPDAINQYSCYLPFVSPDGLMLLFTSDRPGGLGDEDIWVATRPSLNAPFGAPVNFNDFFPGSPINSSHEEAAPCLSTDGRTLLFSDLDLSGNSARPGGSGGPDIWVATRPDTDSAFGEPRNLNALGPGSKVNSAQWEGFPFMSRDWPAPGSGLFFVHWSGSGALNTELWEAEWVPAQWWQVAVTPAVAPSARIAPSMVYDSARGVTLVHGGGAEPGSPVKTDTWAWDGRTWKLLTQQGPGEFAAGFAFDPDRGVAVLHGGFGNGSPRPALGATWEWDGQTWAQVATSGGPGVRAGCAMAYDPQSTRVLLQGGSRDLAGNQALSDTWAWDGTSWQEVPSANGPTRVQHQMVYDAKRQVMVLFGGFGPTGTGPVDTWEFDGSQWHQVAASGPSGARQFPILAYDPMRETVILSGGGQYPPYGGNGYKYFDDLWQWDGNAWSEITPAGPRPPALQVGAGAFDSRRGRLVLFGGTPDYEHQTLWRETWEYGLPELRLTGIEPQPNGSLRIQWAGGAPSYQLQSRSTLGAVGWQDLGQPTDQTSAIVPTPAGTGYFRVLQVAGD
ncbi:MAG: PD40 domain-containing protein [Verrucomicrobiales bacterium]|nr:PD40 domain-containing protein [Verrucomicrobiales bacterium]